MVALLFVSSLELKIHGKWVPSNDSEEVGLRKGCKKHLLCCGILHERERERGPENSAGDIFGHLRYGFRPRPVRSHLAGMSERSVGDDRVVGEEYWLSGAI